MDFSFEKYIETGKNIVIKVFLFPFKYWNNSVPDYIKIIVFITIIIFTLFVLLLLIKFRKEHLFRGF